MEEGRHIIGTGGEIKTDWAFHFCCYAPHDMLYYEQSSHFAKLFGYLLFSSVCVYFFFILLCLHVCVMCSEKKTTHQCSRSWHNNGIFLIQNGDGMNHYRALNMTTQTFLFFLYKDSINSYLYEMPYFWMLFRLS